MKVSQEEPLEKKERGDLDDPNKVGRKETIAKIRARQADDDVRWVLSTENGRRFYWALLEYCKMFDDPFVSDTNTEFFQKGRRHVGLKLFGDLERVNPQAYLQMIDERNKEL